MKHPSSEPPTVRPGARSSRSEPPAPAGTSGSGERQRTLADVAPTGMGIIALDGRWLSANFALATLLGRTQEELLSLSLQRLTHPDDVAADARGLEALGRREISVYEQEKRLIHRSGTVIWVLQQVTASFDNGGHPIRFIWQGRDVTEMHRRTLEARAAEERLRVVVAHAPIFLWAVDGDGIFTLSDGCALQAMEPHADRIAVGRSAFELYGSIRMIDNGGRATTGDTFLRRALDGEACAGLAHLGDATYDTKMVPMRGPEGEVVGVIGVATDVTERSRAEAHLLQTDRLVAVGTLASGVAHEINDPLSQVMRNVDLVSRLLRARAQEWQSAEVVTGSSIAEALRELSSALDFARDGSERVCRIVRDLTTFARTGSERCGLVDMRAVVGPVVNLVSNEVRRRARFVQDYRDVPLVQVSEADLAQVFMNLLVNAAQAIPDEAAKAHEIGVTTCTDDAGRAIFEVWDTGSGIPEDVVNHIFEPFFTTRPLGLSTGLGLSICHGTVTALGGEISVRSAPGVGSIFRVAIPPASLGPRG